MGLGDILRTRIIPMTYESVVTEDLIPVRIKGIAAKWRVNGLSATHLLDGFTLGETFSGDASLGPVVAIDFPVIYDEDRLPCRYDQTFKLRTVIAAGIDSGWTVLETTAPMSQRYRINVRVIDLRSLGRVTTGRRVHVKANAVAVRINSYDLAAATVDGMLITNVWSGIPTGGVSMDWPPVYDPQFRSIPYDFDLRFNPGGTEILGSLTCFELVPLT